MAASGAVFQQPDRAGHGQNGARHLKKAAAEKEDAFDPNACSYSGVDV